MNIKSLALILITLSLFLPRARLCAATLDVTPIPFVYLNQYFNFQIINNHEIKIAETAIDFDNFKISVNGSQIGLDITGVKNFKTSDSSFLIKPRDPQLKDVRLATTNDKLQYVFASPFDIAKICLVQTSAFTRIEMCKDPSGNSESESTPYKPAVMIDGVPFDGSGIVVLKDNIESVTFEASISQNNSLRMTTKKRKIYPRRIQKVSDQDYMQIQFVDVNIAKGNSWSDKLNVDQTYFNIALDPLIVLKQDIYYKNENVKSSEINYVYVEIKKPVPVPVYYNSTTVDLCGMFIGLGGLSSSLKASLISDLGKGVRISSKLRINNKMDAHYFGSFALINFISDSSNPIYNASQSLFSLGGGVSYHLKSKFDIISKLEIRKDLFFRRHDTTTNSLDVVAGINKELSIAPIWTFFETKSSFAHFQFGFSYLLGTTAESESINSGLGYKFNFDYIYLLSFGNIKFETYYYKRQQNSDNFTFNEQTALYSIGYQYLF